MSFNIVEKMQNYVFQIANIVPFLVGNEVSMVLKCVHTLISRAHKHLNDKTFIKHKTFNRVFFENQSQLLKNIAVESSILEMNTYISQKIAVAYAEHQKLKICGNMQKKNVPHIPDSKGKEY